MPEVAIWPDIPREIGQKDHFRFNNIFVFSACVETAKAERSFSLVNFCEKVSWETSMGILVLLCYNGLWMHYLIIYSCGKDLSMSWEIC